jgi:hypothetical protein
VDTKGSQQLCQLLVSCLFSSYGEVLLMLDTAVGSCTKLPCKLLLTYKRSLVTSKSTKMPAAKGVLHAKLLLM